MKRLGKLFTSEWFLFSFFSAIIIIAGTIATPYRALIARPETIYDGTEFYSDDYSIYAGDIMQGQKGRWTVIDKHTTEPHSGTLIHEEYLLWGKFMGLFGINNLLAYQLSRIVFGFLLLFTLYSFLRLILPKNIRLLAFFLILFSAGFPIISKSPEGNIIIRNHMEWFTEIDVFQRFTVLMHYLLGNMFFILSLIFMLKTFFDQKLRIRKKEISALPIAILCGMGMAITHPVSFLVFSGMMSVYLLFSIIIRFTISTSQLLVPPKPPGEGGSIINLAKGVKRIAIYQFKKEILPSFLFFIIATPVLLYYRSQFTLPVWNQIAAWEGTTQYLIPLKDYAVTIGSTFFLAPFGLLALLSKKFVKENFQKLYIARPKDNLGVNFTLYISLILLSWILSFFILFYFSYPFLTISQVRFMQNYIFIPFGILSAIGIIWLSKLISSLLARRPVHQSLNVRGNLDVGGKHLGNLFMTVILLLIVGISLPSYYRSMELKLTIFSPTDPLMFPDKTWVEAIKWLGKNSNPEDPVITAWHAGHAIPYLGGNTVYVGHFWATIDRQKKEQKLYKFLQNQMDMAEMKEFLKETTAKYLFFGYQEKFSGLKPETIPYFNKIFDNNTVQIYQIVNL